MLSVLGCGSSSESSAPADSGPPGDGTALPRTDAPDGDGAGGTGLDSGSLADGAQLPGDAAAAPDGALPEPVPSCSKPGAPVMAARDFLASWGVNASPSAATAATTAAQLNKIGFRRIRTQLWLQSLSDWQALQAAMKSAGYARPALRFDTLVDAYNNNPVTWDDQKPGLIAAGASGLLGSIEGPNEMNNPSVGGGSHGVNDPTDQTTHWAGPTGNLSAWMTAIRAWRDGLSGSDAQALEGVDLIAPTIASGLQTDYQMLPDLGALVDDGTLHYYAGNGNQPSLEQGAYNAGVGYFANLYAWCQGAVSPTKPLVVSECGATTAPGGTYNLHAQAAYFLDQMHEAAGIGARSFYFYTLVDPQSGAAGGSEGNFGMFKTDGSDKDITVALASLKDLFSLNESYDDPANASDTGPFTGRLRRLRTAGDRHRKRRILQPGLGRRGVHEVRRFDGHLGDERGQTQRRQRQRRDARAGRRQRRLRQLSCLEGLRPAGCDPPDADRHRDRHACESDAHGISAIRRRGAVRSKNPRARTRVHGRAAPALGTARASRGRRRRS